MSNLDLEKVGEPEIKLLTSAGTQIKERNTHTHTHTKKKSIKTTYTWSMDVRISFCIIEGFPVAQLVKNPPAMQDTWVRSLGWEDHLDKGTAAHSSILPGEFLGL